MVLLIFIDLLVFFNLFSKNHINEKKKNYTACFKLKNKYFDSKDFNDFFLSPLDSTRVLVEKPIAKSAKGHGQHGIQVAHF